MILFLLVLGTACVFSAGVIFNIFLNQRIRSDLFTGIVALSSGLFILISMIGMLVE